MDVLPVNQNE